MTTHKISAFGRYGRRECSCGERYEGPTATADIDAHIAAAPDGMGVGEAIRIVTQHALAAAARDDRAVAWELYPEISEADWSRVLDRLDDVAPFPDSSDLKRAIALLASRAEATS